MLKHPKNPVVVAIYVAKPAMEGPMPVGGHSKINRPISVPEVNVVKGMGIVGDRWFGVNALRSRNGDMIPHNHARNITFFEEEKFKEIQQLGFDIEPEDIRRNVLVRNFPLNDLVNKEFSIGEARFLGSLLSHGCDRLETMTNIEGLNKALHMRGGIRAAVLNNGTIRAGDKISLAKRKTALVTGANSFLGTEVVKRLSKEYNVLKTGTKKINDPYYFQADLTNATEAKKMSEWALSKAHNIESLICCVGGNKIFPKTDDAYNMESKDIIGLFNMNVLTAINCCRYVLPKMIENKFGKICFVGSDLVGKPHSNGFMTAYTIAKAALHEYTSHLATQLKDTGICVNCVSPCGIAGSFNNGKPTDVSPDEVACQIEAMCDPQSNTTGQVLRVIKRL